MKNREFHIIVRYKEQFLCKAVKSNMDIYLFIRCENFETEVVASNITVAGKSLDVNQSN